MSHNIDSRTRPMMLDMPQENNNCEGALGYNEKQPRKRGVLNYYVRVYIMRNAKVLFTIAFVEYTMSM